MSKLKTKSALSWFGSDSQHAEKLAAMLDHCDHVTIPFCGGLSILPHLNARAVVANDLHNEAINFYRQISGPDRNELIKRCKRTLSHPDELDLAATYRITTSKKWELDRAWAFWAVCWVGRKGAGGSKNQSPKRPSVRFSPAGGMNATRIKAAANDLDSWADQFERCDFDSLCFRDLIPKVVDDEVTGIYIDAPWVGAGLNYLHPFTEQDHRDLASELERFKQSSIVIRYGDDPLVRDLYPEPKWQWQVAESRTQAGSKVTEVWISRNIES